MTHKAILKPLKRKTEKDELTDEQEFGCPNCGMVICKLELMDEDTCPYCGEGIVWSEVRIVEFMEWSLIDLNLCLILAACLIMFLTFLLL